MRVMNLAEILRSKPGFISLKPATMQQIESAEEQLQLKFSNDYREYLSVFGAVSFTGHELTGIYPSSRLNVVDVTREERERNPLVPADWYVIEQWNIDGIVIWQSGDGAVYQSAPNIAAQKICGGLAEYIASCLE